MEGFEPADNKCLLRATDGKRKISTVVSWLPDSDLPEGGHSRIRLYLLLIDFCIKSRLVYSSQAVRGPGPSLTPFVFRNCSNKVEMNKAEVKYLLKFL